MIHCSARKDSCPTDFSMYIHNITLSSVRIEEAMREQGSDLWLVMRNGRIISSRLGEIL